MAILNFSDVLKNVGLDPKRVKLIGIRWVTRHSRNAMTRTWWRSTPAYRVKPSATGMCLNGTYPFLSATLVRQLPYDLFRETCFMDSYPRPAIFTYLL